MYPANEMTARLMGRILSEGMSLSQIDINKILHSCAVDALCKISAILNSDAKDSEKLTEISAAVDACGRL